MKVHHFAFEVSDLEASIRFYADSLGLKPVFQKKDITHNEAYAFLDFDGGKLELLQVLAVDTGASMYKKPEISKPYCPHIAFETEDLDALIAALNTKGVPLVGGPFENDAGAKWVYFKDPDNNILEFTEK